MKKAPGIVRSLDFFRIFATETKKKNNMPDFIEKRNAVDDCMCGIIWCLPESVITPETYEKIREEVETIYDKAYKNGTSGK